jgi:hypothetical protein
LRKPSQLQHRIGNNRELRALRKIRGSPQRSAGCTRSEAEREQVKSLDAPKRLYPVATSVAQDTEWVATDALLVATNVRFVSTNIVSTPTNKLSVATNTRLVAVNTESTRAEKGTQ